MLVTQEHLNHIVRRAKEYGATKVILFGSALYDPANACDIDIAADAPGLDLYRLAGHLEHDLRCTIDIVPLDEDSPFIAAVKQRGKILYDAAVGLQCACAYGGGGAVCRI